MSRINTKTAIPVVRTHEGAPARNISPYLQLRRSVMACMLWENEFYEEGVKIADRIKALSSKVSAQELANLAVEARTKFHLRHIPLLLTRELARGKGPLVSKTIYEVIQRADELAEFLALYWQEKKQPLSAQVKKGLARAFTKFDEYQLAKYDRANAIRLRDVLFLCHAKPKDEEQAKLFKRLTDNQLQTPDTWEVALAAGADKKATFERLISEKKLGYMALLRNLRNMEQSGVSRELVGQALVRGASKSKALPFRFIAAARAVPAWEPEIDAAMLASMEHMERLPGHTTLLVDISGSMNWKLSAKSDLTRVDTACALAILIAGISESFEIFSFSDKVVQVPPRRGMALADAIIGSQEHSSTYLGKAVAFANARKHDRIIVITDEQSQDVVPNPKGVGYMINVASNANGVGYGPWSHIDGFSESVVDFIREIEKPGIIEGNKV